MDFAREQYSLDRIGYKLKGILHLKDNVEFFITDRADAIRYLKYEPSCVGYMTSFPKILESIPTFLDYCFQHLETESVAKQDEAKKIYTNILEVMVYFPRQSDFYDEVYSLFTPILITIRRCYILNKFLNICNDSE